MTELDVSMDWQTRCEFLEKQNAELLTVVDTLALAFANNQRLYGAIEAGEVIVRAKQHKAWHLAKARGEDAVAAIEAEAGEGEL